MEYKFFFSPQPAVQKNEFVKLFYETLSKKVTVVNYGKKPVSLSADYLRYSFKTDVMILNWPEDILHLRFGMIQLFSSFIILTFFKLKGGKIVWICHNKESHRKQYKWLRKITRSFYKRMADIIIVMSADALTHFLKIKHKVYFLNHPPYLKPELIEEDENRAFIDVLIWGNISPYKGLNEFIESYKKSKKSFGVNIIGHADKAYLEIIKHNASGLNIEIAGKFITNDELENYFKNSKIILLPYVNSDTFSSGALIHSLCSNKIIIGPAIGNFIDLSNASACLIYKNFTDLFSVIDLLLKDHIYYEQELTRLRKGIKHYYDSNSWKHFVNDIIHLVYESDKSSTSGKKVSEAMSQLN